MTTNVTGRTPVERIVSDQVWQSEIRPVLSRFLQGPGIKHHKALIGQWIIEYVGNDPHMHEFFVKNWKPAPAEASPHIQSYVFTGIQDREGMKKFLGLRSEEEVRNHRENFLRIIQNNKKYRSALRDPRLKEIERYPENEQLDIALFAPATVYGPQEKSFVSLNTNYYGQLKSKSSLGPLEEYLIEKARVTPEGKILNPADVWLSMHAGCSEYTAENGQKRGIVILAPTGSGKSTHGYGLVEAKKRNRLHSDDWVFVNLASREVMISENQFYMRTNIAGIYPHLIPLLVNQPLENAALSPEIIRLLEHFDSPEDLRNAFTDGRVSASDYRKIREQMIENNAARALIDPRLMVGAEKFIEKTALTDLFLMKRDYDSRMVLKILTEDETIEILTSKGNVFNYVYGKSDADGYGILEGRTTEIYYNPYLCQCGVDAEKGKISGLDKIRIEAYRTLARHPEIRVSWVNTRLPAAQCQFCLRRFLEGGIDFIQVEKGRTVEREIMDLLHLNEKEKSPLPGRREMDRTGLYDPSGQEVEVIAFYSQDKAEEVIAFFKSAQEGVKNPVAGYLSRPFAEASFRVELPETFFKKYARLGVGELLGKN